MFFFLFANNEKKTASLALRIILKISLDIPSQCKQHSLDKERISEVVELWQSIIFKSVIWSLLINSVSEHRFLTRYIRTIYIYIHFYRYEQCIHNSFEYPLILWNIIQIQLYRLCNVNHYYAFYLRKYNINKFLQFLYLVNSYYITDDPIRGLPSTGWNIFTDDFFWSRAVIHYPCCCCYFLPIRNSKNKLIVVSFL